jgi:hypothetical protein
MLVISSGENDTLLKNLKLLFQLRLGAIEQVMASFYAAGFC